MIVTFPPSATLRNDSLVSFADSGGFYVLGQNLYVNPFQNLRVSVRFAAHDQKEDPQDGYSPANSPDYLY